MSKKKCSLDQRLGYFNSPWPGEDGGPQRLQMPQGISGLDIQVGEKLVSNSRRIMFGNMVVLREPGQVYMMTIEMLRNRVFRRPVHSQIEKIDPVTLKTVKTSQKLKGGNMWPGGFAVHQNGDLYVTYGSYCHRLDPDCNLVSNFHLPRTEPYNSRVYPSFPNCVIQAKYSVKAHSQGDSRENIQKCYFWNFDDIKNRSIMKQIIFFSYFLHPITESEEKISIWP